MTADRAGDDELRLARLYATAEPPASLRSRYLAAVDRRQAGTPAGERSSLRPLAAALLAAAVLAAGGSVAIRLELGRGGGSTPAAPAHSPTPEPGPTTPAGVVPWLPLSPAGAATPTATPSPVAAPPIAIPPGTPACRAAQVDAAFLFEGAATGNTGFLIGLRNRSTTACVLDGYAMATVLDASGRVLAPVSASPETRGTFFDTWPQVPVLLQPGTSAFTTPTTASAQVAGGKGQASMNLTWYDCHPASAQRLLLDLPDAGGRLTVPFAVTAPHSPACDGGQMTAPRVAISPLFPAGFSWPPETPALAVQVSISAPGTAHRGQTLVYEVTMANHDTLPYLLDPCPPYEEFLAGKQAFSEYLLNCAPVRAVAPGAQVTFEMRLDVPRAFPLGPTTLTWALTDPRLEPPVATARIDVVN